MNFDVSSRLGGTIAALALCACSSAVPHAEHANAASSISAAEASGAEQVPRAALHLKIAKDSIALAERQMEDGDEDAARLTLERATADAELARTLTTEEKVRQEANQAMQRVQQLESRPSTF